MSKLIIIITLIFLLACEKEYFPDPNAYRDPNLIGTWIARYEVDSGIDRYKPDSVIIVYTLNGYYDIVYALKNGSKTYYTGLKGIWHNQEKIDSLNGLGKIYSKCTNSNLQQRGWERLEVYKFSPLNDTLFLKLQSSKDFANYTKYQFQLNYDDTKFIGIDTIK